MGRPSDPFALGDGPDACLLLHGLTGSPAEVRPVGEALARNGFRAIGPLLPGHGTSPEDLYTVTRGQMVHAAESALLSLRGALRVGPELHALSQNGLRLAHRVRAPALILHGALDRTVAPSGSRRLLRELASPHKELHILPRSGHVLPLDVESDEVCRLVVRHFNEVK